jgi:hypothetical protein
MKLSPFVTFRAPDGRAPNFPVKPGAAPHSVRVIALSPVTSWERGAGSHPIGGVDHSREGSSDPHWGSLSPDRWSPDYPAPLRTGVPIHHTLARSREPSLHQLVEVSDMCCEE